MEEQGLRRLLMTRLRLICNPRRRVNATERKSWRTLCEPTLPAVPAQWLTARWRGGLTTEKVVATKGPQFP